MIFAAPNSKTPRNSPLPQAQVQHHQMQASFAIQDLYPRVRGF